MSTPRAGSIAGVTLHRLVDLQAAGHDGGKIEAALSRIFRATAARWPDDPAAAQAFYDLWLGQYLRHERDLVEVALGPGDDATAGRDVVGYIVGCRIDPSTSPRFASLSYFQDFAPLCAGYPAHLHINLDAAHRGRRIGEHLVESLCLRLAAEGIPGIHVVTGRDMRNAGFYNRLGFAELGRTPRGATEVLFLGRKL